MCEQCECKYSESLESAKKPRTKALHVGVEIEFFADVEQEELSESLVKAKLKDYVQLKDDGSIDADEGNSYEIAIVAPQTRIEDIVKRVCKVINTHGAKVNRTCGLHVHLDMRSREVRKSYSNLVMCLPALFQLVPASRRKNTYCNMNMTADFDDAIDGLDGKYSAVNPQAYDEHSTLEVRLHSGTTNADKINNWIDLLVKIVSAKYIESKVDSMEGLITAIHPKEATKTYLQNRYSELN